MNKTRKMALRKHRAKSRKEEAKRRVQRAVAAPVARPARPAASGRPATAESGS